MNSFVLDCQIRTPTEFYVLIKDRKNQEEERAAESSRLLFFIMIKNRWLKPFSTMKLLKECFESQPFYRFESAPLALVDRMPKEMCLNTKGFNILIYLSKP